MTTMLTHAGPVPRVRNERIDFDAFYAAGCQRLTVQLMAYLGDRAEAQDIVNEAYCRAFTRWKTICRHDDPVAWVRRTAWDLAPKRSRGDRASTDPITRALATLPAAERRVVIQHYMARMSVAEIAVGDRTSESTVTARLARGKAALAAQLTA